MESGSSSNGQTVAEAPKRVGGGRGQEGAARKTVEAGRGGEIESRRTTDAVGPGGAVDGRGVGTAASSEPRRRARGQSAQTSIPSYSGKGGPMGSGGRASTGGAAAVAAATGGVSATTGGCGGGSGRGTGAITGSHLLMNSSTNRSAADNRVAATRRPQQRRDPRGRPIASSAVGVNGGNNDSSKLVAGRSLLNRSTRPPSRPREAGRAGRGGVVKGKEVGAAGHQRVEGLSSRPDGLRGDAGGGGGGGGEPSPSSATHDTAVPAAAAAAAAGGGDERDISGAASLPDKEEQEENGEQPLREEDKGGEEGVKDEDKRGALGATAGSTRVVGAGVVGADRRAAAAADAVATQRAPKRSKAADKQQRVPTVDATVTKIDTAREPAPREYTHGTESVIGGKGGNNGTKGGKASPL